MRNKILIKKLCTASEIWKPIVSTHFGWNFPLYEVSNFGNVRRPNGKISNASPTTEKPTVSLTHGGINTVIPRHKLVCTVFNGPPATKQHSVIEFVNGDRTDCRPANLQWAASKPKICTFAPSKRKMEEEVWVQCEKFPVWDVSNKGRLRSRELGTYVRQFIDKDGYPRVPVGSKALYPNSSKEDAYSYSVHRLVAAAFCERPDGSQCVDHINAIRNDNRAENLRFVTFSENNRNPQRLVLSSKRVIQKTLDGVVLGTYSSATEAEHVTKVPRSSIQSCCGGTTKTGGGFLWEYTNDDLKHARKTGGFIYSRLSKTGRRVSSDRSNKPVVQKENGFVIAEFPSILAAAKHVDRIPGGIADCCRGSRKSCAGFQWEFKELQSARVEEKENFEQGKSAAANSQNRTKSKRRYDSLDTNKRPVVQKINGEVVRWFPSIKAAAERIKRDPTNIQRACKGKQKTCAGFEWAFAKEGDDASCQRSEGSGSKKRVKKEPEIVPTKQKNGAVLLNKKTAVEKSTIVSKQATIVKESRRPPAPASDRHPIVQKTIRGHFVARFRSVEEASRRTGVMPYRILACCEGRQRIGGMFQWEYS